VRLSLKPHTGFADPRGYETGSSSSETAGPSTTLRFGPNEQTLLEMTARGKWLYPTPAKRRLERATRPFISALSLPQASQLLGMTILLQNGRYRVKSRSQTNLSSRPKRSEVEEPAVPPDMQQNPFRAPARVGEAV
jgi:hypothetical protein